MALIILALISGFGLTYLIPTKNLFFRLIFSGAVGFFVITQLTLLFAFIFGVSLLSSIFASVTSIILSTFVFLKFRRIEMSYDLPLFFLIVSLPVIFFLGYLWINQTLSPSSVGLLAGGGGMWGDTALHAAYTSKLELGKFPVENPLYVGKVLVYPLSNDTLSAILKTWGLSFGQSFAIPQVFFLAAFLGCFYLVVKRFSGNLAFASSLATIFLGWGIGFYFFFKNLAQSDESFWRYLSFEVTNNPDYNIYFHNIVTGLILPERSFIPGLFLGLVMFINYLEYFKSKKTPYLIINGIILGSLPFWHTHTFIFYSVASVVFGIFLILKEKSQKVFWDLSISLVFSLIFALPFFFLFFNNHGIDSFIHFAKGWQIGSENFFLFWFKNSFLVFPLAVFGLLAVRRKNVIFFVPPFVVFFIANFVIFQPWDWDNIKLLSWSFIFFSILSGVFWEKLFKMSRLFLALIIPIVFLLSLSGILSLGLQLKSKYILYDFEDIALADWVKGNTSYDDVFVIDPIPNHPVPGLTGRSVYMGYPGHLWVHGINYGERENVNKQIISGNLSLSNELDIRIDYIVLPSSSTTPNLDGFNVVFGNRKYLVLEKKS